MNVQAISNKNHTSFSGLKLNKSMTNTLYAAALSASMLATGMDVFSKSDNKTEDKLEQQKTELYIPNENQTKKAQLPWLNKKFTSDVNDAIGVDKDSAWGPILVFLAVGVAYVLYRKFEEN